MPEKPYLSRTQLASFLKDPLAIKQFEALFKAVEQPLPDSLSELFLVAGNAQATSQQALAELRRIADALELLALASSPADGVAHEDDLAPPMQLGTMAEQQADRVSISGGGVTAQLKNNQSILLQTTATLSNAAAAAAGTLLNSPAAGNPSKWVTINDNGTLRRIPTW